MTNVLPKIKNSTFLNTEEKTAQFSMTDASEAAKVIYKIIDIKEIYLREKPTDRIKLLLVVGDGLWFTYKRFILSPDAESERNQNVPETILQRHGINLACKFYSGDNENSLFGKMNLLQSKQGRDLYTHLDLLVFPQNWKLTVGEIQKQLPFLNKISETYVRDLKGKVLLLKK